MSGNVWSEYRSNPTEERRNELAVRYYSACQKVAAGLWRKRGLPPGEQMEDWIAECAVYMLQTAIPTYDPAKCQKFELFLYFWLSRRLTDRIHSRQHREDKRSRQLVEVEYIAASTLEVEELEAKLRLLLGDEYIDGRLNGTIRRDGSRYGEKHYTGNTSYAVNRKLRNVRERLK